MSGFDPETGVETGTLENKYAYLKIVNPGLSAYGYGTDSDIKSWDDLINAINSGKRLIINYNDEINAVGQTFTGDVLRLDFIGFNYLTLLNKTPISVYSFEVSEEGIKKIANGEIVLEQ